MGDLLIQEAKGRGDTSGMVPTMAIVSARGGMTDLLVKVSLELLSWLLNREISTSNMKACLDWNDTSCLLLPVPLRCFCRLYSYEHPINDSSTNTPYQVVNSALTNFTDATTQLDAAVASQLKILHQLAPPDIAAPVEAAIQQDAKDILSVVQSLKMINSVPPVSMEVVTGFGEIWSAQTLHAYLQTQKVPTAWLDAREVLVVKSEGNSNGGLGEKGAASTGGVVPLWEETASRLSTWWNTVRWVGLWMYAFACIRI